MFLSKRSTSEEICFRASFMGGFEPIIVILKRGVKVKLVNAFRRK